LLTGLKVSLAVPALQVRSIAGLVAITPAAGYVDILPSIIIGFVAGVVCHLAMIFRTKKKIDESLDAWAVHGIGGLWGAIATGIFANAEVKGLIFGNSLQPLLQGFGAISAIVYASAMTYIIAKIVDLTIGLRVGEMEEYVGLDISQHGEVAYS